MIRYPKRNIAQKREKMLPAVANTQITDTSSDQLKPALIDNTVLPIIKAHLPSIPTPITSKYLAKPDQGEEINCQNAKWHNILYPAKLWQINNDLDQFAYGMDKLTPEEKQKLHDRLPSSMGHAERQADTLLKKFVQNAVRQMGRATYVQILESAATDDSKVLFALRCAIAASQGKVGQEDSLIIYHNDEMRGGHFYPEECKKAGVDAEGKEFVYYTDNPDKPGKEKDYSPYWRSENHTSKQHKVWQRIKNPQPGKQDMMPAELFRDMQEILLQYNIVVNTHADAWKLLDQSSKRASVEDRILARIMYLIANAQHNKI